MNYRMGTDPTHTITYSGNLARHSLRCESECYIPFGAYHLNKHQALNKLHRARLRTSMLPHLSYHPAPKLHIIHAPLPHYVEPFQPPTKRQPFSTLWQQQFVHTLDVTLPTELVDVLFTTLGKRKEERDRVKAKVAAKRGGGVSGPSVDGQGQGQGEGGEVKYAKVMMGLRDVLETEFLDGCVKKGWLS